MSENKGPEKPEPNLAADGSKIDLQAQLKDQRKRTNESKDKIDAAYNKEKRKIRTPLADFNESIVKSTLERPLNELQREIDRTNHAFNNDELQKIEDNRKQAEDFAVSYIQKMAQENGGIDVEVLTKMLKDMNHRADLFANLLISGKHADLVQAYFYALGSQGKYSDMAEAGKEAFKTLNEYLKKEFDKNDSEAMPYVWSVLAFMTKEERIRVARDFCGKDAAKMEKFLEKGNIMGVYTAAEIQELNSDKKYSKEELARFANNWQAQNDFKAEASRLGIVPYGSENAAGKMLNLSNLLLGFAKFGAAVTIVGNFMTGAWQGGQFSLQRGIGRLLKPQSLGAAALYGAIKVGESKATLDELFNGNDAKKAAAINLQKEKNGNPKWSDWDKFFKQQDFAGADVFFRFIQSTKKYYDETDLNKMANYLTPANFEGFLNRMAARKKAGKPDTKNVDYAALRDGFKKINPSEILTFAKIFDTLNLGGATVKDEYALYLELPAKEKRGQSPSA